MENCSLDKLPVIFIFISPQICLWFYIFFIHGGTFPLTLGLVVFCSLLCEEHSGNHLRTHRKMLTVSVVQQWWLLCGCTAVGDMCPALEYLHRVWKDRAHTQSTRGVCESLNRLPQSCSLMTWIKMYPRGACV